MPRASTWSDELRAQVRPSLIAARDVINSFQWQLHIPLRGLKMMLNRDDIGTRHVGTNEQPVDPILNERETHLAIRASKEELTTLLVSKFC